MSAQVIAAKPRAVFTQGSTLRHVIIMTATASVGLFAIFIVDFFSLLYVSWLKNSEFTAAVGYASQFNFFAMSVNIGMMIPIGAAQGGVEGGTAWLVAGAALFSISGVITAFLVVNRLALRRKTA